MMRTSVVGLRQLREIEQLESTLKAAAGKLENFKW